jgi:hypothetical protein
MFDYLSIIQACAIVGVSCVLITTAAGEAFAVEPGPKEPSDDPNIPEKTTMKTKYTGWFAGAFQKYIICVSFLLFACFTTIVAETMLQALGYRSTCAVTETIFRALGYRSACGAAQYQGLKIYALSAVSINLVLTCATSFLMVLLRHDYMRKGCQTE